MVFEGCDRVGKSTQCRKLVEALNAAGKTAQLLKFPGDLYTHECSQCVYIYAVMEGICTIDTLEGAIDSTTDVYTCRIYEGVY